MKMAHQLKATSSILSKVEAPRAPLLPNKPAAPSYLSLRNNYFGRSRTRLTVSSAPKTDAPTTEKQRRSANYIPSIWDYNSLSSAFLASSDDYTEAKYGEEVKMMKTYVKGLLVNINGNMMDDPLEKLELIDVVQRLGLQYHFDAEIKHVLGIIYEKQIKNDPSYIVFDDLYATALQFRLLRQHGFNVHQDVFKKFMDSESDSFKETLSEDVKGMLSLYEASFLGRKNEVIIDEAMTFSTASLKTVREKSLPVQTKMARMVDHALDMPIHRRPNRLEARWFIDEYKEESHMNPTLLRLAKLDYNMVQSVHQDAVAELIRWWVGLGLSNKLTFFRDRLLEHYLWISIMTFQPQYKANIIASTKILCMLTTIDDCYDVYGTPEELELLTEFIDRWDITAIDKLPHTIRSCFLGLFNTTNEVGLELMLERGINFIPYIQQAWADECKAYLQEAKWFHGGIKPTFKEYYDNGVFSVGALILIITCFLTTTENLNEENLDYVSKIPSVMRSSSVVIRLTNDLATSSYELARGDNLKAIECYMAETGCSEGAAREHIKSLVKEAWKIMNDYAFKSYPVIKGPFVEACLNLARAGQCFYQYGDGHALPYNQTKQHIMSVLVQPIPMDA